MGLFDGIKRVFNICGASIVLELEKEVFCQNDAVTGVVVISGGENGAAGREITAELQEYWTEMRGGGKSRRAVTVRKPWQRCILSKEFSIEPGSEYSYPIELQLPLNCRLSGRNSGWNLIVNMDIPMALDPEHALVLNVVPGKELLAVVEAVSAKLGFEEKMKISRRWNKVEGSSFFSFIPPDNLKKELDYLDFQISQTADGGVFGKVIYNLQEKQVKDYFKALFGADNIVEPFQLGPEEIFLKDASVNFQQIVAPIENRIQQIIQERDPYNKMY